MVDDYMLDKVLDKIKEIIGIGAIIKYVRSEEGRGSPAKSVLARMGRSEEIQL